MGKRKKKKKRLAFTACLLDAQHRNEQREISIVSRRQTVAELLHRAIEVIGQYDNEKTQGFRNFIYWLVYLLYFEGSKAHHEAMLHRDSSDILAVMNSPSFA